MKGLDKVTKLQIHILQTPTKNNFSIVHRKWPCKPQTLISLWLPWHTGGWTAPGHVGQRSLRCHFVGCPLQRRRKLTTDPRGAVVTVVRCGECALDATSFGICKRLVENADLHGCRDMQTYVFSPIGP